MAPAKKQATAKQVKSRSARTPTGALGRTQPNPKKKAGVQDAPRVTPEWVEEALAWIKAERERHGARAESHMRAASTWAASGYIDIATNELRAAVYESGMTDGLRNASMRLMEGQQGIR